MGGGAQSAAALAMPEQPAGALRRVPQGRDTRRSRPLVGRNRRRKGSRMMRKTSLILLGAAAGAALTLIATQPRIVFVGASAQRGGRRHLPAAQPVRRRVRAGARRLRREARRRQAGRIGDQRHADRARSAFELHGPQELPRHAGADPRRVRRPRHRGHDGGRPDQGGGADRRDAGRQGRHPGQRHHHPSRRRAGAGPDAEPGGREDARPGATPRSSSRSCARARTSRSRCRSPATSSACARCARASRATTSATSASPSSTSRPPTA